MADPAQLFELPRFVMVDDEEGELTYAELCFRRAGLDRCFTWLGLRDAASFRQHMERCRERGAPYPAVILLDLNMPGESGYDILEWQQRDVHGPRAPRWVVLTNSVRDCDRVRSLDLGADLFQIKPATARAYISFFEALPNLLDISCPRVEPVVASM